jgi:hypothetical protein
MMKPGRGWILAMAALWLAAILIAPAAWAQRGSFGGGRGFGGGFGGGRSPGGGRSYGSPSSSRPFGGSFGGSRSSTPRSGTSFSSSRSYTPRVTTQRPGYASSSPVRTSTYSHGGTTYTRNHYDRFSDASYSWQRPSWLYYTPFFLPFYFHPPVVYGGTMYPGGFNWGNLILALLVFAAIAWVVWRLVRGSGQGPRRRKPVKFVST